MSDHREPAEALADRRRMAVALFIAASFGLMALLSLPLSGAFRLPRALRPIPQAVVPGAPILPPWRVFSGGSTFQARVPSILGFLGFLTPVPVTQAGGSHEPPKVPGPGPKLPDTNGEEGLTRCRRECATELRLRAASQRLDGAVERL